MSDDGGNDVRKDKLAVVRRRGNEGRYARRKPEVLVGLTGKTPLDS